MNKQDIDFKTNLQNNIGLIKAGIWNGTAIDMSYGGTGTKLIPIQGGIVITSDKTMGILSSGSVGQLLAVANTGGPTWSTLVDLLNTYGLDWLNSNVNNAIDGGFPSDNYSNITTIDGGIP